MTAVIQNESTVSFSINGIDYQKNYTPLVVGNKVMIISAYDTKNVILKATEYANIEINGTTYTTVEECANALSPLLFTKQAYTSSGAVKSTSTTLRFFNSNDGVSHSLSGNAPLVGNLVIDPTGQVEGGFVSFPWTGDSNPDITGVAANLIQNVGLTITAQGVYLFQIWYSSGLYYVNITQPVQYVGAGGGGTNQAPVITLTGLANVNSTQGQAYVDAGATATDAEDGDLTSSIVVGGDTVDINTIGSYVITYDVQDSQSLAATQVTRTVNVVAAAQNRKIISVGGKSQYGLHDNNADSTANTNRIEFRFRMPEAPTNRNTTLVSYGRESTFADCKVGITTGTNVATTFAIYVGTGSVNHQWDYDPATFAGKDVIAQYIVGSDTCTLTIDGVGQGPGFKVGNNANIQGSSVKVCQDTTSRPTTQSLDYLEIDVNGSPAHAYDFNEADGQAVCIDTVGNKDITLQIGTGTLAEMRADI